jgi:hypothetical protein
MNLAHGAARWVIDLAVAGGLVVAQLLVYGYEARMAPGPRAPGATAGADGPTGDRAEPPVIKTTTTTEPVEVQRTLKLAVTKPEFDDMGQLLGQMGEGYSSYTELDWPDLADSTKLGQFDVLFLTCARPKESPEVVESLRKMPESLREFVRAGKTLYVSDLWYPLLGVAFPEAKAANLQQGERGAEQTIDAEVSDPSLQDTLGSHLQLKFDQDGWDPPRFEGAEVRTLVRGGYKTMSGSRREGPLLVKFPVGNGTVIFTSFHNAHQAGQSEIKLLKSLVVIVATARLERELRETVIKGGLSPRKGSLLTASRGGEPVTASYTNPRRGRLKFILGFEEGAGAELKLTVRGPDGQVREQHGTGRVEIEIV